MRDWFKSLVSDLWQELNGKRIAKPLLFRSLAFLIDYLVLILSDWAAYLITGLTGNRPLLLLHFVIALAYFGLLNSRLTNGQTIGKKIFRIRTINSHGEPLGIPKSILRSIPASLITNSYSLGLNAFLVSESLFKIEIFVMALTYIGVLILPLANSNRGGIEDLMASSRVIGVDQKESPWNRTTANKVHTQ